MGTLEMIALDLKMRDVQQQSREEKQKTAREESRKTTADNYGDEQSEDN